MTIPDFVTNICKHSGIDPEELKVELTETDDQLSVVVEVSPEDSGLLIGFHGETLQAMQRITRIVYQETLGEKRLVININNYREQREEKIKDQVISSAQRVLETGRPATFSFLPPNERFIIHSTISEMPEFADLESVSEGEGKYRVLTIRLKQS